MPDVNIRLLAKELNLSIGTVSKALKDSYEISAGTKSRVLELANKLHYKPNLHASSLRQKKSKTIAVVLPEVADSFFAVAINGIEAMAHQAGFHVLIYLTNESVSKEAAILKDFQTGRVDGVLMSITAETSAGGHLQELYDSGMPIVFFDRVCEEIETAKITTDDFDGGYKATQHLIDCGCKRIALVSISATLSIINHRVEGYKKALADQGLDFCANYVLSCSDDIDKNTALVKGLLQTPAAPDGIIASVEKLTSPVYLACRELGLEIPTDVKVLSFSNLPTAAILNPSLTTITQPAFEMGKVASTILLKALSKPGYVLKRESVVIPSTLIVRDSTRRGGG
ncbi:LacI family transcriptional regulator [Segetibacter sp. 3557_3]|nr:LacI family transcriptional regulator [Segetibacter sp. 3557_3]